MLIRLVSSSGYSALSSAQFCIFVIFFLSAITRLGMHARFHFRRARFRNVGTQVELQRLQGASQTSAINKYIYKYKTVSGSKDSRAMGGVGMIYGPAIGAPLRGLFLVSVNGLSESSAIYRRFTTTRTTSLGSLPQQQANCCPFYLRWPRLFVCFA
jgi:hypothetical protein